MKIARFIPLVLAGVLGACGNSAPRSTLYFAAHLDEARKIVSDCGNGSVRGDECSNANVAVAHADAEESSRRFFGNGTAYTPIQTH